LLEDKISLVRLESAPIEGESSDKLAWARLLWRKREKDDGDVEVINFAKPKEFRISTHSIQYIPVLQVNY